MWRICTDIKYEYPFVRLSSSKRDADNNSEYDRFEARQNKNDEAMFLINKTIAEQTIRHIETVYGPFSDAEISHYRKRLTDDGRPIINSFQKQMVGYLFFKSFGDPVAINTINQTDYIKMIIAAKRLLLNSGMTILPYIISSRVTRVATRKNVNKKELIRLESSELYNRIQAKYNNPKVSQRILEMIGKVISSSFEIIDFDNDACKPSDLDGRIVPIINDMIDEELLFFICMI